MFIGPDFDKNMSDESMSALISDRPVIKKWLHRRNAYMFLWCSLKKMF